MSTFRWLTDLKVPLALHSDFTMAPARPLFLMWTAVDRVTINGVKEAGQTGQGIEVKEAFDAITITVLAVFLQK